MMGRQSGQMSMMILASQLGQSQHLFQVPPGGAQTIYTINAIESFNRQLHKVTKAKSVLPTAVFGHDGYYQKMGDYPKFCVNLQCGVE